MSSGFLVPGKIGPVAFGGAAAASSDWWQVAGQTCVAAYQPIGAASLAASYVNLANPGTYDAAPGTAPTLAADGWISTGAAWLDSGIVPVSPDWSMVVRFSDVGTSGNAIVGCYSSTPYRYFSIIPNYSATTSILYQSSSYAALSTKMSSGILAMAGRRAYKNGSDVGAIPLEGAGVMPSHKIYLCAENQIGVARSVACTIAAIAIYSTTLSAADVAALTTRMQAL